MNNESIFENKKDINLVINNQINKFQKYFNFNK